MIALYEAGGTPAEKVDYHGASKTTSKSLASSQQGQFFIAQVLLASSAPLLFACILSLSQIDDTLGLLTQITWTMFSHLARFSAFVIVNIASFAVTFNELFFTCSEGSALNEAYGTFTDACLTMFRAMLGDFDFDNFKLVGQCNRPPQAEVAGVGLLVFYLAIMSILLLNLLIAVLSTVHAEVSEISRRGLQKRCIAFIPLYSLPAFGLTAIIYRRNTAIASSSPLGRQRGTVVQTK